ncbi:MAG: hypothetical protein QM820_30010 [Minicystis sp.]
MSELRRPIERVAILSFHSHGDRSFLDDRDLAIASGDLRDDGIPSDLVLVAFGAGDEQDRAVEAQLVAALDPYDTIVFERVWSAALVARLRAALPGRIFIHCRGEHVLDDPPADYICPGDLRQSLPALIDYIGGKAGAPPKGSLVKKDGAWIAAGLPSLAPPRPRRYAPNLRPVIVNPDGFPGSRTFSIQGNNGCPYQADARDNPIYAGAVIPEGLGRGCAFCTTGNDYEARPAADTARFVLEQLRYVRTTAPELQRIVLKDQNPFAYLTEVVQTLAAEGLGPFTLMLETRADWLTRSARRFDDALRAAKAGRIRISPFLVGIESFSQPELDRYNKGTTAEANIEFIERLWSLRERYGETLDLESASFGFVLFSPWTTLDDLENNLHAIQRTRFDKLRGRVLHSRARLYPDTALYYLAERDGLFIEAYREGEDASRRYGYYPARPWRFLHDDVAHFAALATKIVEQTGGRDEIAIFAQLVKAFRSTNDYRSITADRILAAHAAESGRAREANRAPPALRQRFERLVRPLPIDGSFAGGWSVTDLVTAPGLLRVHLGRAGEEPVVLEIVPRGDGPSYARSRHYDIRFQNPSLSPVQRRALDEVCGAITANDR